MKPKEKKPETVFRIIDKNSGEPVGSYSRAFCDEYDFSSVSEARNANCHGMFQDKEKYKIAKYKVTYTLIEDECEENYKSDKLDLQRDQHLMSIRQNGERIGDIEIVDGKITTTGIIGDNQYDNFVELIKGLQGFDIKIDEFYW